MIRRMLKSAFLLVTFFAFVLCSNGHAQNNNGTIRGTVTDSTGAVLTNASVVLVNVGTAEQSSQLTNKDGYYTFTDLAPADYTVKVTAPAFAPWEGKLTLRVAQEAVINAKLKPGSVSASITVTDVTPAIDAADGTISDVKEATRIETIPVENSDFLNILNFSPGVVANSYGGQGAGYTRVNGIPGGSVTFYVDGQSANDRSTNDMQGTPPALQTIQELKVTTSNGSAEFSTPGVVDVVTKSGTNNFHGQLREIYQTGGFSALGFNNITSHLVHNDFGGQLGGPVRIPLLYNGKNKTFFFFDYNKIIQHSFGSDEELLPQQDWTQGNFTDYIDAYGNPVTIYDPLTGVYNPETGYVQRSPMVNQFANGTNPPGTQNVIDTSRESKQAAFVLGNIPAPNINLGGNNQPLVGDWNWGVDWRNPNANVASNTIRYTAKVDQLFGKNLLSARYTYVVATTQSPSFGGNSGTFGTREEHRNAGHNGSLSFTSPIGARAVNEAHIGIQLFDMASGPVPQPNVIAGLQSVGIPVYPGLYDWPGIYWGDQNQFALAGFAGPNVKGQPNSNVSAGDSYSWTRAKHEVKVGFGVTNYRDITQEFQNPGGNVGFSGDFTALQPPGTSLVQNASNYATYAQPDTGAGLADMYLGLQDYSYYQITPVFHTHQTDYHAYVQDNWKMTPRLTVNLGLRWEYWSPYTDADGLSADLSFDTNTQGACSVPYSVTSGQTANGPASACVASGTSGFPSWYVQSQPTLVIPNSGKGQNPSLIAAYEGSGVAIETASQAGWPASLWNMPKYNFAPRLGLAYQLNDKTVMRGGYGMYEWTMPLMQYHQNTRDNIPWNLGVFASTDNAYELQSEIAFPFGPNYLSNQCNCATLPSNYVNPRSYGTDFITPALSPLYNTQGWPVAVWDPNFHPQIAQEWNLTVERTLPGNFAASIGYVGNHGSNLPVYDPINAQLPRSLVPSADVSSTWMGRPYPIYGAAGTGSMDEFRFIGYSNHNEGRVDIKHTFKGSFILQSYFTYGKSLGTSEGTYDSFGGLEMVPAALTNNATTQQRLGAIYAPDSYIANKNFVVNGHYELPLGKGKQFLGNANTAANELVSGWNVSMFYLWHSGLFFSPYYSANPGLGGTTIILAPGAVDRGILPRHSRSQGEWFNASVWDPCSTSNCTTPYQGQTYEKLDRPSDFANFLQDNLNGIPRNYMTGPGFSNADGTLYKLTPIGPHTVFDMELQVFNVFNHTNLGLPSNGGSITSSPGASRQLQFQGKITF